ncbi:hypothetical protein SAMN05421810_11439 [Amycolatopsis arida]|uniref:Repeat domain-containing protein n=1 Tax=Amycolatopsis arida TaxID=587909 RepID=A0A1I6ARI0_9PSEU|nr:hypothetical protein [Amycolatopsis arida]TDX97584.1 hypothetical protein CLV69_102688 [Amycolatopsis arida]SFQ71310.1 hypothetical protein SAMN05421810_11439 [Amycolatopsis arida]
MSAISRTTRRAIASALALATAGVALAPPAHAASDPVTAYADLDGDGRQDRVTVEPVADNPNEQLLTATVRGIRLTARVPFDSVVGVQPMRVLDVDGDGREEVAVTEVLGAHTRFLGVWGLLDGLRPVRMADGTPVELVEGGGISSISRYGCRPGKGGRELVQVGALLVDWETFGYEGERVTYSVRDGVAVETARTPVSGGADEVTSGMDPATCA